MKGGSCRGASTPQRTTAYDHVPAFSTAPICFTVPSFTDVAWEMMRARLEGGMATSRRASRQSTAASSSLSPSMACNAQGSGGHEAGQGASGRTAVPPWEVQKAGNAQSQGCGSAMSRGGGAGRILVAPFYRTRIRTFKCTRVTRSSPAVREQQLDTHDMHTKPWQTIVAKRTQGTGEHGTHRWSQSAQSQGSVGQAPWKTRVAH